MLDDGFSINRHHFIPKSRGGREMEYCHRICHDMLHRTWSNKELEKEFSDPEKIKADPRMQTFITWIQKKEPQFYIRSDNKQKR